MASCTKEIDLAGAGLAAEGALTLVQGDVAYRCDHGALSRYCTYFEQAGFAEARGGQPVDLRLSATTDKALLAFLQILHRPFSVNVDTLSVSEACAMYKLAVYFNCEQLQAALEARILRERCIDELDPDSGVQRYCTVASLKDVVDVADQLQRCIGASKTVHQEVYARLLLMIAHFFHKVLRSDRGRAYATDFEPFLGSRSGLQNAVAPAMVADLALCCLYGLHEVKLHGSFAANVGRLVELLRRSSC